MNAQEERGSDSENFGTRITGFGVVVEKIWNFEVFGLFHEFFLRLGTSLELFFQILGASLRNYGLRVNFEETEGPLCKIPEITDFQIYSGIE
jgi:hypothetical protein